MSFHVIAASKKIGEQYRRYLRTAFDIADPEYREMFLSELNENGTFSRGPYLDVLDSFEKGSNVKRLIHDGVLSEDFARLEDIYGKTLYSHQERALKRAMEGRNLVVSTGTGSGKTECFLLPILNTLMREKEEKGFLRPGVRALLIYPMNALANDQIDRLRRTLSNYEDITFGCYTGQTENDRQKALEIFHKLNRDPKTGKEIEPLPNEILSREEMKENPPHILITNYAMLEYLMLRPRDSVFFDGQYASDWKFIVLDEAHTYTGSTGIEVSMLLRRLRAKLRQPKLQYILTSATLGDKDSDEAVAAFAENLCAAPFSTQDIIRAERVDLTALRETGQISLNEEFYNTVNELLENGYQDDYILKKIEEVFGYRAKSNNLSEFLFELLLQDQTYWRVKEYLSSPRSVYDICAYMNWTEDELTAFVEVASHAVKERTKLFDSRYHLFLRATEGVFITLPPHKSLSLNRKTTEYFDGQEYKVFEAVTCAQCHALYLVGQIQGSYLVQKSNYDVGALKEAFLVGDAVHDDDEDESLESENLKTESYELCPHCGFIRKTNEVHKHSCEHDPSSYVKLIKVQTSEYTGRVTKCIRCESVNSLGILRSFFSGQEASTSVIGTALFDALPAHESEIVIEEEDDDGFDDGFGEREKRIETPCAKQFIAFSDSRQAAAYFASYFSETYDGLLYGKLINEKVRSLEGEKQPIPRFVRELATVFRQKGIAPFSEEAPDFEAEAWKAVLNELVNNRSRNSLMSLGLFHLDISDAVPLSANTKFALSLEDVKNICLVYLTGMLSDAAVFYDRELTDADIQFFTHNGFISSYLSHGSNAKGVYSFVPKQENKTNKRKEYLERVLKKKNVAFDAATVIKLMEGLWNRFFEGGSLMKNVTTKYGATGYRVDTGKLCMAGGGKWYRCPKCQRITPYNVANVCPTYLCDGELNKIDVEKLFAENHYYRLYNDFHAQPMRIVEHTAQLNREEAYHYQNLFKQKKIDILSCSTTFEMGVDVGDLETVFMRNMPPTPSNYAQRAGRAGRSATSAAFALTFCNKSNHDFHFFGEPISMIKGVITPPAFKIDNEKIAIRHVYASALSFFWKTNPQYFKHAQEMMEDGDYGENGYTVFREYLEAEPYDLKEYLLSYLPSRLSELFDVENFGWVRWLFDEPNVNYPNFKRVYELYHSEVNTLLESKQAADQANKNTDFLRRQISNYRSEGIVPFLSKNSILPKYGFPVDTVQLSVTEQKGTQAGLDLSRDLAMAISEYAPGCQIVANGKLITSRYIRKVPQEHWKMYDFAKCGNCQTLNIEIHTEEGFSKHLNQCKQCGKEISASNKGTFLIPDFGFIADPKIELPTLIKPERTYRTEAAFVNYDRVIPETKFNINGIELNVSSIDNGAMAILTTDAFYVCQSCGYALEASQTKLPFVKAMERQHKTPSGRNCGCKTLEKFSLGYRFETDVTRIRIDKPCNHEEAYSVLQALILAACAELNIDNNEIAGCLQYYSAGIFYFILYDTTPGGAGHVKQLNQETILKNVLQRAYLKARNCTCGNEEGDSSCYSCLRTYQNQKFHDMIKRRYVFSYLNEFNH